MGAHAALKLTEATFEDWLATFGVKIPRKENEELHRPELLRFVRDWQYPAESTTSAGLPAAVARWNISERADKDRFFKEPGFVFGVTVTRPKVYLANQKGAAVIMMDDAYAWLPAVLAGESYTSLRELLHTGPADGPLGTTPSATYWIDLKDLFLFGDQFANFAMSAADKSHVALPSTALAKRYAASADADALFSAASPANTFHEDGIVSLNVLGTLQETT